MFGRVSCVVWLCAGVLGGCDGEITPDASVTRDASIERDGGVDGGGVDGGLVADDAGPSPDAGVPDAGRDSGPPPVVRRIETVDVADRYPGGGAQTCLEAVCPEGTVPVGGGGSWGAYIRLRGLRPTRTGYVMCGEGMYDMFWSVHARCAEIAAAIDLTTSAPTMFAASTRDCAVARCRDGYRVVAGGFRGVTPSAIDLDTDHAVDGTGWEVCGVSREPTSLSAVALCVSAGETAYPEQTEVFPEEDIMGIGDRAVVGCPDGMSVASTGGEFPASGYREGMSTSDSRAALIGISTIRTDWTVQATCLR
ncbi:MAG: hypothetical protein RLP09_35570 [Sandaracinaceae bacterium]